MDMAWSSFYIHFRNLDATFSVYFSIESLLYPLNSSILSYFGEDKTFQARNLLGRRTLDSKVKSGLKGTKMNIVTNHLVNWILTGYDYEMFSLKLK